MCNDPKIRIVWDENFRGVISPLTFYRLKKRVFRKGVFLDKENLIDKKILAEFENLGLERFVQYVSCGKCCGCRADWSLQWTARCMLEARRHKSNLFVTLTYNDEHLPVDGSLCKEDYQKYFKRVRKWQKKNGYDSVRYRICGEYGERNGRPHFHFIGFGLEFPDMWLWYYTDGKRKSLNPFKGSYPVYRSDIADKLWSIDGEKIGHVLIGKVTYASIKYVSNYQLKLTGQDRDVKPFARSSSRPALGRGYYEEHFNDIIHDFTIPEGLGLRVKHVKYFDKLLARDYPEVWLPIQQKRISQAKAVEYDTTADRCQMLRAREERLQKLFARKHRD